MQLAEQGAQSNLDDNTCNIKTTRFNTALANRAFGQQRALASDITDLQTADINQLGRLGGLQQAQQQAILDAQEKQIDYRRLNLMKGYQHMALELQVYSLVTHHLDSSQR